MERILALLLSALLITVGLSLAGIDMKMWRIEEHGYPSEKDHAPMQPISLYRQSYMEPVEWPETLVWMGDELRLRHGEEQP